MYKDIVIKFIRQQPITEMEINEFITTHIKIKKNVDITAPQLVGIRQLIGMGMFNLDFAIKEAIKDLKLQVISVIDPSGKVLRVDIEEQ